MLVVLVVLVLVWGLSADAAQMTQIQTEQNRKQQKQTANHKQAVAL